MSLSRFLVYAVARFIADEDKLHSTITAANATVEATVREREELRARCADEERRRRVAEDHAKLLAEELEEHRRFEGAARRVELLQPRMIELLAGAGDQGILWAHLVVELSLDSPVLIGALRRQLSELEALQLVRSDHDAAGRDVYIWRGAPRAD